MEPLLSIIITIYNKEQYLSEAIESIINQSLKRIEIICVDDGSTDGSGKIADLYAEKDSRIIVLHKENGGLVSARKAGINIATAKYIGFVDADDWIDSDMFKRLYDEMSGKGLDMVSSGIILNEKHIQYDALEEKVYAGEDEMKTLFSTLIWDYSADNNGLVPNTVTKLYRRDILVKSCIGIDNRIHFHEDDSLVYSYVVRCKSIGILHKAYYHYRYVENSDSNVIDELFFARQNYFYLFLKNEFNATPYYDILMSQLNYYVAKTIIYGINHMAGFTLDAQVHANFVYAGKRRIVVYGAGKHGSKVIEKIIKSKNHELVAVIDKNLVTREIQGYIIQDIESIKKIEFDLIIISIKDEQIRSSVYKMLVEMGISESKIATD